MAASHVAVVQADLAQALYVAERLRAGDRDECEAAYGGLLSPRHLVEMSLGTAMMAWTGLIDGEPACVFGCGGTLLGDVGRPWLVGTDKLLADPWAFLRRSRRWLSPMVARYSVLENWVDARNTASIRWLTWLGFTLHSPEPWGVKGLPFHRFSIGD